MPETVLGAPTTHFTDEKTEASRKKGQTVKSGRPRAEPGSRGHAFTNALGHYYQETTRTC